MPPQLLPLDSSKHLLHGWSRQRIYRFARKDAFAPLLLAELGHAITTYPLAFIPCSPNGYQLVALLGLHAESNLFVDETGAWGSFYIPGHYRAYPFSIIQIVNHDTTQYMLGFDQGSGLYREAPDPHKQEMRFFDDNGHPAPRTQEMVAFLVQSAKNRGLTQRAVDALAAAKLMEPWELSVETPEGSLSLLTSLYRINLMALRSLPGGVLEILRDTQALDIAYAHILSLPRLAVLRSLSVLRAKKPAPPPIPASLDSLFGNSASTDMINFDWLEKP